MTDLSQAVWRKASLCHNGGSCVEIAVLRGHVGIRDNQNLEGGAHVVGRAAFAAFLADVQAGRYDLS